MPFSSSNQLKGQVPQISLLQGLVLFLEKNAAKIGDLNLEVASFWTKASRSSESHPILFPSYEDCERYIFRCLKNLRLDRIRKANRKTQRAPVQWNPEFHQVSKGTSIQNTPQVRALPRELVTEDELVEDAIKFTLTHPKFRREIVRRVYEKDKLAGLALRYYTRVFLWKNSRRRNADPRSPMERITSTLGVSRATVYARIKGGRKRIRNVLLEITKEFD